MNLIEDARRFRKMRLKSMQPTSAAKFALSGAAFLPRRRA
jgi:hypothetical protein